MLLFAPLLYANADTPRNDKLIEKNSNFEIFKIFKNVRATNVKSAPVAPGEKSTDFKFGTTKLKLYTYR